VRERRRRRGTTVARDGSSRSTHRNRSAPALVRAFLARLRGHRGTLAFALGTLTLSTALGLLPPAATKFAVDNVFLGQPLPEPISSWTPAWLLDDRAAILAALAIAVAGISIVRSLVHLVGRWQATRVSKLLQSVVRREVFEHAVRLPLHRVHALKAGGMSSLLRDDAGGVGELLFSLLYNPWRALIQLVGILAILAVTDWRLLLGSALLLPILWFSHRAWIGRIRPIHRDARAQRSEVDGHAAETFGGLRVVRGFARERSEASRIAAGNHLMSRQELLAWWWSRGIELAWEMLVPIASALLLFYGGRQVLAGTLTPGDLILFLTYLVMLLGPIEALAMSAASFQTNLAGLDRVLDLLEEPRELPDRAGAIELDPPRVRGEVEFDDVSFRYPGGADFVLRGVSFRVKPGSLVALVGASGAGKTTLCNLVARFFDPTSGSIRLDGIDLRNITLASHRRLLGIVEQDVFLFDGTIAENIAYGARDSSPAAIRAAAKAAALDSFIDSLPEREQTVIGERGVRLSGGQRQRVAIARAILADPRLLILDEATSNLDTENERRIQEAIALLVRDRTTFVIAHRLSTVAHADRIIVLRGGRVLETGTHAELLAAGGAYRDMVAAQTATPERPRAMAEKGAGDGAGIDAGADAADAQAQARDEQSTTEPSTTA